jgi:hypothetical protein
MKKVNSVKISLQNTQFVKSVLIWEFLLDLFSHNVVCHFDGEQLQTMDIKRPVRRGEYLDIRGGI